MSPLGSTGAGVAAVLVRLLSLTGCGTSRRDFASSSAKQISDRSEKAMLELRSPSLEGEVTSDGTTMLLSLHTDTDGACAGSIGLGGGTADLVGVDGEEYLRADERFWAAAAGTQARAVITFAR